MSLPNYLTLFRICLSPIFLFLYIEHDLLGISDLLLPYVLLGVVVLSELTDAFDGVFARKYNQVTELGKVLDPMADSISKISAFLTFTLDPIRLPLSFVFIFFYRDAIISMLRTMCALKGYTLAARKSGKIKTVINGIAILLVILLMIPHATGDISTLALQNFSAIIVGIAAAYTIYSGIEYIHANWHYLKSQS